MRTTTVPAQITTVEDKIAGDLNLTQIILLLTPVFSGSAIYVLFPPFSAYALYKLIIILCVAAVSCGCAIRFKEKMVLQWIGILARYSNRPRHYLYNKNDQTHRAITNIASQKAIKQSVRKHPARGITQAYSFTERVTHDLLRKYPKARVSFKPARKGGMYVVLSEIK